MLFQTPARVAPIFERFILRAAQFQRLQVQSTPVLDPSEVQPGLVALGSDALMLWYSTGALFVPRAVDRFVAR